MTATPIAAITEDAVHDPAPSPLPAPRAPAGRLTGRTASRWWTSVALAGALTATAFIVPRAAPRPPPASPPAQAAPGIPECKPGLLCEAGFLNLSNMTTATDHFNFTGQSFAAGFEVPNSSLTFVVVARTAGANQLTVRYANSTGGDYRNVTRTLTVTVDDVAAGTLSMPTTANWDTWSLASVPLDLAAGRHEISLVRTVSDSGRVNIDSLAILPAGTTYPTAAPAR